MDKMLYIFVEGPDDSRFFDRIGKDLFRNRYDEDKIRTYEYSTKTKEKINDFLRIIGKMGADYICQSDLDEAPCASKRKERLKERFSGFEENRIIVVKVEIESWYLALLDDNACKRFKINPSKIKSTDQITKEQFNALIPKKFDSRVDFMVEILGCASIETAKQRNTSFKYFVDKYYL
jgi:hypothetical protein